MKNKVLLYRPADQEQAEIYEQFQDVYIKMCQCINAGNQRRTQQVNAEYAVASTGDNFSEMFASMDDDYMKARAADIKDISDRLVRNLSGYGNNGIDLSEPMILVADDLSPSETVQMDKEKILAFVTVHGSSNSHTAILARMMNIPALIGVDMNLDELHTGMEAAVNGFTGEFQRIDREVFGKSASVDTNTCYIDTGPVSSGTCHGVIGIRKSIINIFL